MTGAKPEAILVVDDDDLYVRAITRHLRQSGYMFVFRACSSEQALAMRERVRPAVVLTDMVMEQRDSGVHVIAAALRYGMGCAVISGLPGLDAAVLGVPVLRKSTVDGLKVGELVRSLIGEAQRRGSASLRPKEEVA